MPCFFGTAIFFAVSGAIACGSEENPGRWFCRSGNLPALSWKFIGTFFGKTWQVFSKKRNLFQEIGVILRKNQILYGKKTVLFYKKKRYVCNI